MRHDGNYVNMLNMYGTMQDNSTAYQFRSEGIFPDMYLTDHYESNGLFAKIIDAPAEEALKHGFDLGLQEGADAATFITDTLDDLAWDEAAATAIRWARLYGGAIGVMLVDDGRGIDDPLDIKSVKSIEEIRVYERAVVWPDYSVMYDFNTAPTLGNTATKYGMPEKYFVNSIFGQFWVHESRCLIFRNGILPERTMQPYYRFWGAPEYLRIRRELRETITSHSLAVKMLERSVQAVHGIKDLVNTLQQPGGVDIVLKRLQAVDKGRNILNSIAIDAEGESYEFKNMTFSGIKDVLESACNILSAVTNISQAVLFGRSPAGMNATGESDLENYYNYIERIQKLMLRGNMCKLVDIIVQVGLAQGKFSEAPQIKLAFNPLWSMSDEDQAKVERERAQTQQIKAQTAKIYVDMQALDPSEVRKGLAGEEEYSIEDLLDGESGDIWGGEDLPEKLLTQDSSHNALESGTVGVIVVDKDGRILGGIRSDNGLYCAPGGHIEPGETPTQAAIRETQEEFNITPTKLLLLDKLKGLDEQYGEPYIYLCTEYEGDVNTGANDDEMVFGEFRSLEAMRGPCFPELFPPFAAALEIVKRELSPNSLRTVKSVEKNTKCEGGA